MKGHVGDGARSGGFEAPGTGLAKSILTLSFVSITFDSAGNRLLAVRLSAVGEPQVFGFGLVPRMIVTQT